jgi:hypothetical protein
VAWPALTCTTTPKSFPRSPSFQILYEDRGYVDLASEPRPAERAVNGSGPRPPPSQAGTASALAHPLQAVPCTHLAPTPTIPTDAQRVGLVGMPPGRGRRRVQPAPVRLAAPFHLAAIDSLAV